MNTTTEFPLKTILILIGVFLSLFVFMLLASKILGANKQNYENLFVITTKNESGKYMLQIIYNGELGEGASVKTLDASKIEVDIRKVDDTHNKFRLEGTKEAYEPIFIELPPEGVKKIKVYYNGVVIGRG